MRKGYSGHVESFSTHNDAEIPGMVVRTDNRVFSTIVTSTIASGMPAADKVSNGHAASNHTSDGFAVNLMALM